MYYIHNQLRGEIMSISINSFLGSHGLIPQAYLNKEGTGYDAVLSAANNATVAVREAHSEVLLFPNSSGLAENDAFKNLHEAIRGNVIVLNAFPPD